MPFETSQPVQGHLFYNRKDELNQLRQAIKSFQKGQPSYQVLIGFRKVGKSSILKELSMQMHEESKLFFVLLDCWSLHNPYDFFWMYVSEIINQYLLHAHLAERAGLLPSAPVSSTHIAKFLTEFSSLGIKSLIMGLEIFIELTQKSESASVFRNCLELPEKLAKETGLKCQIILDEFQELVYLNRFKVISEHFGSIFPLFRSQWQNHLNVNYIISGSQIKLLKEILEKETAPFFQHFKIISVKEFPKNEALNLLVELFTDTGKEIEMEISEHAYELLGGSPFYLQCLGEEMLLRESERKISQRTFQIAIQESLLNQNGRLNLYFQNLHDKMIGNSVLNEKVILTIANAKKRASEIARDLGVTVNVVGAPLNNLIQSGIICKENGFYQIMDRGYALWLRASKSLDRRVLPPLLIGTLSEEKVARKLKQYGFSLVYQSKASRGTFDLLAILNELQLGIQVKKCTELPYYISSAEFEKIDFWSKKLRWLPLICLDIEDSLKFYEIFSLRKTGKNFVIETDTPVIENLISLYH